MLIRILKSNTRSIPTFRIKRYGSTEIQHQDYEDPYKANYERLWRNKATLDWLPKAEGNWQEINGKKQVYYNKILASGIIAFILSLIYLKTIVITRSGALTKPPYHIIGNDYFPGSKYEQ